MNYTQTIYSKTLNQLELRFELTRLIQVLCKNRIMKIELLFGFAWGNEYRDWEALEISPNDISTEIEKAELTKLGALGKDDVFITIESLETQVVFCHESDIHISFNITNDLVSEIRNIWQNNNIINVIGIL
ncbi:hypothetical protein K1X84_15485 [bacterium]|nr:hypothetical protein [bacterium]